MPSTLRPRSTYSGSGLKKRPLKKYSPTAKRPPVIKKWAVSSAPSGLVMTTTPTKIVDGLIEKSADIVWNESNLSDHYTQLKLWADKNKLQLTPMEYSITRYNEWSECFIWTKFKLTYNATPNNTKYLGGHTCSGCSAALKAGQTICNTCARFQNCGGCYTAGLTLHGIPGETIKYCGNCAIECTKSSCSNLLSPTDMNKECATCSPREACHICKTVTKVVDLTRKIHETKHYQLCKNCVTFVCETCGIPDRTVSKKSFAGKEQTLCGECVQKVYDKERKKFESWTKDDLPPSGKMILPSSASRPIRTVSLETEFDGSGSDVAKALYRAGLIEAPAKAGYSTQGSAGKRLPCLLKSDGSVTGGELLTYLLDLDNENHAAALLRMTEVMRGCRELGHAKFSSNAGGHIHIDLHNYSIDDLWTLYTTFKYLEMPLYYLAGAGADYGHRSLKGSSYANPPNGGPYGTKESFANGFRRGGRSGLNLSNFNGALQSCICGAVTTGDWKKCSCNLGKATAEWRLWNAEINPRILHAWIAIMQSVTAYAADTPCNESAMPYLNWGNTHFKATTKGTQDKIKERLEWMHRSLPFTRDERDSLVYAAKRSELIGLGETYLDGLMKIRNTASTAEKDKPRNPSSRKRTKFALTQHETEDVSVLAPPVPPTTYRPSRPRQATFAQQYYDAFNSAASWTNAIVGSTGVGSAGPF